ncbi:MAG: hypothetical protein BMS9Abin29_1959 [Gemmatimonadota bacterium]|nr:MAG: hypothetical protein BMS9Abin29_1959 [Gemmatimonadota bacterium]
MLATWMVYGLTLGILISAGAFLIEAVVRLYGGPTRRVWAAAILMSALVPAFAFVLYGRSEGGAGTAAQVAMFPGVWFLRALDPFLDAVDGSLALAWVISSGVVTLGFLISAIRVRLASRAWDSREVDGVSVLVSEDVGPAVIGALSIRVVIPRWALEFDSTARRLMLRHEQQHVAAGDPHFVLLRSIVLSLMPWNAPVWFMAKRLRLAIEVDCDRRVLREDRCDVQTYGSLLVEVGRRKSGVVYAGPGFSWARSLLEHRILQMTARSGGRRALRAGGMLVVLALVLLTAGFMPRPPSMDAWATGEMLCARTDREATPASRQAPAELDWRS